jgi:hypothetical protein
MIDQEPDQWLRGDGISVKDMQMLAESENMVMSAGQPLAPTEGATEEHTIVHLMYTNSVEFQALPPEFQQLIGDHLMGVHEDNPNTGSLAGQVAPGGPAELGGNQNLLGEAGPSINAETSAPQAQPADLQGASY